MYFSTQNVENQIENPVINSINIYIYIYIYSFISQLKLRYGTR